MSEFNNTKIVHSLKRLIERTSLQKSILKGVSSEFDNERFDIIRHQLIEDGRSIDDAERYAYEYVQDTLCADFYYYNREVA